LDSQATPRKKASKRYWRDIKDNLYARLQYQDSSGKWKEKLHPISDKRLAQSVVADMRHELELRGQETLISDTVTFSELADRYE
jgi:hypothetical protein